MEKKVALVEHYKNKWNLIGTNDGKRHYYMVSMQYSDTNKEDENPSRIDVVLEFDEAKPEYGLYFGCKIPKNEKMSPSLKDSIWTEYKSVIYGNRDIQQDYVFHPDCESCKDDNDQWAFWIRLEEEFDVFNGIQRIGLLTEVLRKYGYK